MHLYGDKYRPVVAWNAVNVPDSEGFLRHGNVIDAVDGGLIVDFDCPSQRSEFVEYGNIFNCAAFPFPITRHDYPRNSEFSKNGAIQVLIRARPDQPWTWLPGKLLECDFRFPGPPPVRDLKHAFVEVQMENDIVRELVPDSQVRLPLSTEDLAKQVVGKEHFVKRSCSLPKNYWTSISPLLSSLFGRDLEYHHKVLCTSVFSERLTYLQRHQKNPIQPDRLEALFSNCKAEIASDEDHGWEYPNADWICRRSLTKPYCRKTPRQRKAQGLPLPVELLIQVLQCLDTVDRLRCRRTCALWNAVLNNPQAFGDVRVSFARDSFSPSPDYEWDPSFAFYGCLMKCITSHTRTVVITVREEYETTLCNMMDLIKPLLTNPHMKRVIFNNSTFELDSAGNVKAAMDDIVQASLGLDVVTFKNCTLPFLCDDDCEFDVHIPFGSVQPGAPDAAIRMMDLVRIR